MPHAKCVLQIVQIPQCTCPTFHNAQIYIRNWHILFCSIVDYGTDALWDLWHVLFYVYFPSDGYRRHGYGGYPERGWGTETHSAGEVMINFMIWKRFPHYWPFVGGIGRFPSQSYIFVVVHLNMLFCKLLRNIRKIMYIYICSGSSVVTICLI